MIYPFWYVLIYAFSKGSDAQAGGLYFFPRAFTFENFQYVLKYPGLQQATLVTLARCIVAPVVQVSLCMLGAYALSKRQLPGRKAIITFLMVPMFIGGTVVSNYIIMAKLKLLNNFLIFVLPGAFSYFTSVILRAFIDEIPGELQESALIDGASYPRIFVQIILPLCKASIAAFLFFGVVGQWLDLNTNLLYITKKSLYTLQYIMHRVITSNEARSMIDYTSGSVQKQLEQLNQSLQYQPPTPQVIKMAIIALVTMPILFIYPFFQKYFVKGMLTGSVKA